MKSGGKIGREEAKRGNIREKEEGGREDEEEERRRRMAWIGST